MKRKQVKAMLLASLFGWVDVWCARHQEVIRVCGCHGHRVDTCTGASVARWCAEVKDRT